MSQGYAVEVVVAGRVQGVCFRAGCAEEADRLGVAGWVSNHADGTVRGRFEGSRDAVRALVEWCHDGSSRARVDAVDVREVAPDGAVGFSTD